MEALTTDQLLSLLRVAKQHSRRDHLMILMAYLFGLRASEVTSLTTRNFRDGYLTVQRLKGSRKTVQPLISHPDPLLDVRTAVEAYLTNVPAGARLFPCRSQFFRLVRKYAALAGVPEHKAHPHVLKHSCAKLALAAGMPIDELQQYLGHESLASTGAYLRSTDESASAAFGRAVGSIVAF
jgi:integrase/recombinase XerD